MAYLFQSSADVGNSSTMTMSAWVRCPTSDVSDVYSIMEFGSPATFNDSSSDIGTNGISVLSDATIGRIFINLHSVTNSINVQESATGTDLGLYRLNPENSWGSVWTALTQFSVASTALRTNKWFHFLFAADFSSASSIGSDGSATSYGTAKMVLNGVLVENDAVMSKPPGGPIGSLWSEVVPTGDIVHAPINAFTDPRPSSGFENGDSLRGAAAPFYYDASGPFDPPGTSTINVSVPGWQIDLSGFEIGIPCQIASAGSIPKVQFQDVQIWLDRYIDPVANYSKFVTLSAGRGTPVKPSVAAASFGTPTYLFTGGATRAGTNGGTGGPFTKVGTIKDAAGAGF